MAQLSIEKCIQWQGDVRKVVRLHVTQLRGHVPFRNYAMCQALMDDICRLVTGDMCWPLAYAMYRATKAEISQPFTGDTCRLLAYAMCRNMVGICVDLI